MAWWNDVPKARREDSCHCFIGFWCTYFSSILRCGSFLLFRNQEVCAPIHSMKTVAHVYGLFIRVPHCNDSHLFRFFSHQETPYFDPLLLQPTSHCFLPMHSLAECFFSVTLLCICWIYMSSAFIWSSIRCIHLYSQIGIWAQPFSTLLLPYSILIGPLCTGCIVPCFLFITHSSWGTVGLVDAPHFEAARIPSPFQCCIFDVLVPIWHCSMPRSSDSGNSPASSTGNIVSHGGGNGMFSCCFCLLYRHLPKLIPHRVHIFIYQKK